jgi:hypothetical protein
MHGEGRIPYAWPNVVIYSLLANLLNIDREPRLTERICGLAKLDYEWQANHT